MTDINNFECVKIQANDDDALLIMEWRNDETTRLMSINSNLKHWDTFKDEYYNNYLNNPAYFVTYNNIKIAFVSFIPVNNDIFNYKIGINLSPEYRGKNLSKYVLLTALKNIESGIILAEIKQLNFKSIKLFESCGFTYYESDGELNKYVKKIEK